MKQRAEFSPSDKMPFHDCPRFNSCNVPNCPLDPEISIRVVCSGEAKCRVQKSVRTRISKKYGKLLPYKGLTKQEHSNKKRSERILREIGDTVSSPI